MIGGCYNAVFFFPPKMTRCSSQRLDISSKKKINECLFLIFLSRSGIQQRRNSYEDGVYGTTCPIPPGRNFTYIMQVKDQIGSFYYFPSLAFHKAAGGFGGIRILSRPRIPVPFPDPAGDYTVLIGDWYKANHTVMHRSLDAPLFTFTVLSWLSFQKTKPLHARVWF